MTLVNYFNDFFLLDVDINDLSFTQNEMAQWYGSISCS